MPCEIHTDPKSGTTFIMRLGKGRRAICKFCRRNYATLLCDAPTGIGKTCDAPICPACAINAGPDTDYCPDHRNQQSLFGGTQ